MLVNLEWEENFLVIDIIFIIIGFIILTKGADLLIVAATSIAKKFGLSEMLIGLTIIAIGTSLPELFVTITSAINRHSDLIMGNAIGSCICNFLLVIGITSLVKPIKLDKRIVNRHLPIGMASMVLLLFLGNTSKFGPNQTITRLQGGILLLYTFLYILYTIYEEKKLKNKVIEREIIKNVDSKEQDSIVTITIYMILGIVGLKFGADLVVNHSILIAEHFKLTEKFIGMTIIAIGTALPEIVTGIIAAKKNETDLLLGNISGSNILNLCLLIGLGAVIYPLTFTTNFNNNILILIMITILVQLIAVINKKSELNKKHGILLIVTYILYIFTII